MQKRVAKDGGKKFTAFLKRNIYYVLMVVCVVAIGTMITVAAVVNKSGGGTDVVAPPGVEEPAPPVVKPIEQFVIQMPVANATLGRAFNETELLWDATRKSYRTHTAVDVMASAGSNVTAVYGGVVTSVVSDNVYGTTVVIDHKNGYITTYMLVDATTMTKGKIVNIGEVIGKVSAVKSFESAQGEHIHIEMSKDGKLIDPMQFLASQNK